MFEVVILFVMVMGLLMIGAPVGVALGLSLTVFLLVYANGSQVSVANTFFDALQGHYTLPAITFSIRAAAFTSTGGVAQRRLRIAIACVDHLPGGPAIAGVFACMLFAALSGSSPATVVAAGSIVIASMTQVGHPKEFGAGVVCKAGTLVILLPPSIVMVVYAATFDVSVGRMFLAGVIPGLLAGGMPMVAIYDYARGKKLTRGKWACCSKSCPGCRMAFASYTPPMASGSSASAIRPLAAWVTRSASFRSIPIAPVSTFPKVPSCCSGRRGRLRYRRPPDRGAGAARRFAQTGRRKHVCHRSRWPAYPGP